MATIKSAIQLYDGVSPALKSMNKALNTVLSSFEAMQEASSNSVDTSAIKSARNELAKVETTLDGVEANIKDADAKQKQFNQEIANGSSACDNLGSKIKNVVSAFVGLAAVKKSISWISEAMDLSAVQTNAQNQLKVTLNNMGAAEDAYDKLLAKASNIQSKGIYGDEAMIGAAAEFATYMTDTDAIESMMDTLSNYAMGMSGGGEIGTEEMVQYATNLGKIMTGAYDAMTKKGFEFTDAQKAVIEGSATEAQYIEALGEDYKSMSEDMRAATVINNIIGESWDGLYDSMSDTPEGAIISLKNAWGDIKEMVGNRVVPGVMKFFNALEANLPTAQTLALKFADAVSWIADKLAIVIDWASKVAGFFQDNWGIIEPIIMGIVAALVLYNTVSAISAAVTAAHSIAMGVKAAADAMATGTTFAATAAQYGFNAALMACPITWIVLAVIALVAAIVAVCNWIAKTTGVAQTGFGVITGGIAVVGATFKNLGLLVANIALGIWEAIGACCSNIGTAFHNVISSVQSWWYNLLSTALTVVAGICEALNKLPFVDFDYSGITSKADAYAAKASEAAGNKESYKSVSDAFSKGFNTYDAFGDGWASDAFQSGAAWGDGVVDKVKGMFSTGDSELDAYNTASLMDNLASSSADTAGNTAAMKDSMDTLEDSLEYMVDIAEREAINRFTTAEIKVDMTNNNNISSDMDIDGVCDALSSKIYEAMLVSAEGVHN